MYLRLLAGDGMSEVEVDDQAQMSRPDPDSQIVMHKYARQMPWLSR